MARTRVAISRGKFEDWLFELCPVFEFRAHWGESAFVCPLSNHVAIVLNMRGHMKLASRKTGRLLRLDSGEATRRYNHATKNWEENWAYSFNVLLERHRDNRNELNRRAKRLDNLPARTKKTKLNPRTQQALINALDKLEVAATNAGDKKTSTTAGGAIRRRVQEGRPPTTRQANWLREKLERYKIYVPSAVAA